MQSFRLISRTVLLASIFFPVMVISQRTLFTSRDLESASHVFQDFEPCISNHSGSLVIIVKSGITNTDRRRAIRETWASESRTKYTLKPIFVLGYSSDPLLMSSTADEETDHGDLLMGNFQDDYYNLTLKTVFTLSWMQQHHRNKWLLYVDDDAIVNLRNLYQFVSQASGNKEEGEEEEEEVRIYCYSLRQVLVIRDPANKWYVNRAAYPNDRYPDYCIGFATLMPSVAVSRLLTSSLDQETKPKLWIDDVFVTGIAAAAANVSIVTSSSHIDPNFDSYERISACHLHRFGRMMAAGQWEPQEMRHEWSNIKSYNPFVLQKRFLFCHITRNSGFYLILLTFNAVAMSALIILMLRSHLCCLRCS